MSVPTTDPPITPSLVLDDSTEQASKPSFEPLILKPSSGWAALDLYQVWLFRDLLFSLASRDIKLRYKQTALGIIWVVLQPLISAIIFAFIFNKVAGLSTEGVPPLLFAFAGLLCWTAFSATLTKVSGVLIANSQLVSKVYFPRLVLPLSSVISVLVDIVVSLGMLFFLMIVYRWFPGWSVLSFPLWLAFTLMFATGIGLNASALMVHYRDVQYILPVAIQFLMYASPVGYSLSVALSKVEPKYSLFFYINPLTGLLEAFRWSLLGTTPPPAGSLLYSLIASVVCFVTGAFAFRRMERRFADVI